MLYRLARLLFGTPEDIDLAPALGRMQPVEIHSYSSQDFGTCREFYLLNEPGRFPPGVLPDFEATLREDNRLFLVAKMAGKLCGCGGISIKEQSGTSIGWLCFGLIPSQTSRSRNWGGITARPAVTAAHRITLGRDVHRPQVARVL